MSSRISSNEQKLMLNLSQCKDIENYYNEHRVEDGKYLITGEIQSGKTNAIVTWAVNNFLSNRATIIIPRNIRDDVTQLENSIKNRMKSLKLIHQYNIITNNLFLDKDDELIPFGNKIYIVMSNVYQIGYII